MNNKQINITTLLALLQLVVIVPHYQIYLSGYYFIYLPADNPVHWSSIVLATLGVLDILLPLSALACSFMRPRVALWLLMPFPIMITVSGMAVIPYITLLFPIKLASIVNLSINSAMVVFLIRLLWLEKRNRLPVVQIKIVFVVIIVFVALLYLQHTTIQQRRTPPENPQYTRSECIVRLNMDWSGVPEEQIEEQSVFILHRVIKSFAYERISGSVNFQDGKYYKKEYLYYQLKKRCDEKHTIMQSALKELQTQTRFQTLPIITISKKTFQPGDDTINSQGDWWIDGRPVPKR